MSHSNPPKRTRVARDRQVTRICFREAEILDRAENCQMLSVLKRLPPGARVVLDLAGVYSLASGFWGSVLKGVERGLRIQIENAEAPITQMVAWKRFVNRGVVGL